MTSEREAVARAILATEIGNPIDDETWGYVSIAALPMADAAIAEIKRQMETVTPEMVEAGKQAFEDIENFIQGNCWEAAFLTMLRHHPLFKEPASHG